METNSGDKRMNLAVFSGRAHPDLARTVAARLEIKPGRCILADFPDHELNVAVLENLQGRDVFLIQPTQPPAADHLLELLLLADAARRAGAARLTAVIPYFGYARQDHRDETGKPVAARLIAELLSARFDRLMTVDLHNPAIEGFFAIPVEHLSAVKLLAKRLAPTAAEDTILVAPDLGAVKLAQKYARHLNLPVAYINKVRLSGEKVSVRGLIGEIGNRSAVVVDDMISTGGTILSAVDALLEGGARQPVTVAATHGLLTDRAQRKLADAAIGKIILTDSISPSANAHPAIERVSLARMIARTIQHMHESFRA